MDDNTNFSSNDNTNTFLILNTSNKNINSSKDFSNENLKTSRDILNKNIHVIKSENCGLGKTEKIKKEIKAKGKKYIHFPVGGNITRDILFKKLKTIVDKIEESENNDVKNVAIHLDLYDNNEHSILNEFLFSFLITKFYSNSENVLYIPIDIEIFVEVSNCFEDFISKYKILNSFEIENIKLDKKQDFDLPEEKLLHFKNMLDLNDITSIYEYINKYFNISNHS